MINQTTPIFSPNYGESVFTEKASRPTIVEQLAPFVFCRDGTTHHTISLCIVGRNSEFSLWIIFPTILLSMPARFLSLEPVSKLRFSGKWYAFSASDNTHDLVSYLFTPQQFEQPVTSAELY
jgi:hypothetical protein